MPTEVTNDEIQRDLGVQNAAAGSGEPSESHGIVETETRPDLIWDDEARGLCIRAYGDGSKSFIFVYRIEDRQEFIRIGTTPVWSLDAARKRAKKLRCIIDKGLDPVTYKPTPDNIGPVENIIDYIAEHLRTE
jgi:hypothetical protein